MANELALLLIRLNLALGAAILLALVLRAPLRRWSGADLAYCLWVLPPLAIGADLLATAISYLETGAVDGLIPHVILPAAPAWLTTVWFVGAAAGLLFMIGMHGVALLQRRRGTLGPAVVGLIRPKLCLPKDFAQRFTPEEQRLIRAHERVHMERNDVLANALMGVLRCVFWFNPLVHVAAIAMKHDQELACDAQVMDVFPDQRRRYAAAMLKAGVGPSVVCNFGAHPLSVRITAIVRGGPQPHPRVLGIVLMGVMFMTLLLSYASTFGGQAIERYLADYGIVSVQPPAEEQIAWMMMRP